MSDQIVPGIDGGDPTVPPRPAAPGRLLGRATGAQLRVEGGGHEAVRRTVLTFRVPTASGLREVELRGVQLEGGVRDGDWVEVADPQGSGPIQVATLANLTTGSTVRARRRIAPLGVQIAFVVIFLVVLGLVVLIGLEVMSGFNGG